METSDEKSLRLIELAKKINSGTIPIVKCEIGFVPNFINLQKQLENNEEVELKAVIVNPNMEEAYEFDLKYLVKTLLWDIKKNVHIIDIFLEKIFGDL